MFRNPDIPHDAINAGTYYDSPFFIGRSNYKGSVQVGMVSKKQGGLVIAYDGKPVLFHDFEVLCGPVSSVKWVSVDGRLELAKMKHGKPFACGNEKDGTPLFAGRTTHKDNEYGGKVSEKMKGMLFPHNGKEKRTKEYLVLCSH
ncbi:hypothetical protein EC988_003489 [Linderina pennispora]|nr:hypothetical protein EC988_003489 [Linderina pennispora]